MELEALAQKFESYHGEVKGLAQKLSANEKHWDAIEARLNRQGLEGSTALSGNLELRAVGNALRTFLKSGDESALGEFIDTKSMSSGSDPDGGYSVIPAFSNAITKRIFELSPMRRLARVVPISTGVFEELVDLQEAEARWIGETNTRSETTTPQLGKLTIAVDEIYANAPITQTLLDDSMLDLGSWLTDKVGQRFARLEVTDVTVPDVTVPDGGPAPPAAAGAAPAAAGLTTASRSPP